MKSLTIIELRLNEIQDDLAIYHDSLVVELYRYEGAE